MLAHTSLFLLILSLLSPSAIANNDPLFLAKFDYRQTFKRPIFFGSDSSTVPYFLLSGTAAPTSEFVRLANSLPNQQGTVSTAKPNPHAEWEIHFSIRISGKNIGGQGLSFWYSKSPLKSGSFYGADPSTEGYAVVIDSSDIQEGRAIPLVYALPKNPNIKDRKEALKVSPKSCFREIRNSPVPVWVRITYFQSELHVYIDLHQNGQGYSECFFLSNVNLPPNGYFGLSASSGDHTVDDFDVHAFEVYEINPKQKSKKLRPHEQAHITKEGEYRIDTKTKDRIKNVQEEIRKVQESTKEQQYGHAPAVDPQSMSKIVETQFKIIESLDIIMNRLEILNSDDLKANQKKDTHYSQSLDLKEYQAKVTNKLDTVTNDIRTLTSIIETLSRRVYDDDKHMSTMSTLQTQLNDIKNNVQDVKTSKSKKSDRTVPDSYKSNDYANYQKSSQSSSNHSTFFYLLAFTGGVVVMYVISVIWRSSAKEPRKFV